MLIVSCPECKKELKLRDDLAGKKIKCPGCGLAFVVSAPQWAAETTDAQGMVPPPTPAPDNITSKPPENAPAPATPSESETPKRTKKRSKGSQNKSKTPLFVGLGAAALLLFCFCPLGAMATWYFALHESKPSAGKSSGKPVANDFGPANPRDRDRDRDQDSDGPNRQPKDSGLPSPPVAVSPFAPKDPGKTNEPPKGGLPPPPMAVSPFAPKDPGKTNPLPKDGTLPPPPSAPSPFAPKPNDRDPGKARELIVGKWLNVTHVWTFSKDGHVEIDLGHAYKGTYKFLDAELIECKAEPKSSNQFDGRWKVAVTDTVLKIDDAESFDRGRPQECPRLTHDDPDTLDAAKEKLTGKWTLASGKGTQPKAVKFDADGGVEIEVLPKAYKGTYSFVDETIIYIHDPGPAGAATKRGLWRVEVNGSVLKFGPVNAKPVQMTSYKKTG